MLKVLREQFFTKLFILLKISKPLLALLSKVSVFLVKILKGASVTKMGLGISTFGVYSVLIDWRFAVCLMALIGIHESGHVWAMRKQGMATKGFYFVPFFGGMAVPASAFPNSYSEGYVAIMGPIWGLFTTAVTYIIYLLTNNQVFEVSACWMAFVNLLNLLPLYPLDGGRIVKVLIETPEGLKNLIGKIILIAISISILCYFKYFLFIFIFIIGIFELFGEQKKRQTENKEYHPLRPQVINIFSKIATTLELSTEANPNDILKALDRTRRSKLWRKDLQRFHSLRQEFRNRLKNWIKQNQAWIKAKICDTKYLPQYLINEIATEESWKTYSFLGKIINNIGQNLTGFFRYSSSGHLYIYDDQGKECLHRGPFKPYWKLDEFLQDAEGKLPTRIVARIKKEIIEFRRIFAEAKELLQRIEKSSGKVLSTEQVAQHEQKILFMLGTNPEKIVRFGYTGGEEQKFAYYFDKREWDENIANSDLILLCLIEPRFLSEFMQIEALSRPPERRFMQKQQRLVILAITILTLASLFAIMEITGGSEVAQSVVQFFKKI